MVKQSLWFLKSHKNIILKIFIKLSGSGFVLLLCMKPFFFFFRDGNGVSHDCVIFQGVLSRTLVFPSREVERKGKAFREGEQLIYVNDCPHTPDS